MKDVLVLGAGQLARMMALAAAPMSILVRAYDVRTHQCLHPVTGEKYSGDLAACLQRADAVTAEFEHIPDDILTQCNDHAVFHPNTAAIRIGGDRRKEKVLLAQTDVSCAPFEYIHSKDALHKAIDILGLPLILKSALDGYDGKGQWLLKSTDNIDAIWQNISDFLTISAHKDKQAIIAERFIPFTREVSLIGARNIKGEITTYPLTENIHQNGILQVSFPDNHSPQLQQQAETIFRKIAESLEYIGVLAIEFFHVENTLLVNEIAPRVHNSGHWTQQGSAVCQFEQHIRAVTGLPLGESQLIRPCAMINIIGINDLPDDLLEIGHLHWYNKEAQQGRKVGHINICANTNAELVEKLIKARVLLHEEVFPSLDKAIERLSQNDTA